MAGWEYLEVIRDPSGSMADATGRYWDAARVNTSVGHDKRGKAFGWLWGSSTALAALGAEGWELSAVVSGSGFPAGGVHRTYSNNPNAVSSVDLLIFKRPKP